MSGAIDVVAGPGPIDVSGQSIAAREQFVGADALRRAVAGDAEWLWLLDWGGRADDDALRSLVAAATEVSLAAGVVVDAARATVVEHLPTVDARSAEKLLRLCAKSCLPIRSAPFANALVRRACFERHGLPDERRYGRWAPIAWTAAVLRDEPGTFVPASVVEIDRPAKERTMLADGPAFARMTRSGAWTRGDAVRAFQVFRRSR